MKKINKIFIVLGIVILLVLGPSLALLIPNVIPPAEITYELNLKVGYYDNAPKTFENENGQARGIFPELLTYIASKERWNITWIKGDWEDCLIRLNDSDIDVMIDVAYSENRSEIFDFNNEFILNNWGMIYTKRGANIRTFEDLKNKTVSVMIDSIHTIGEEGIYNINKSQELNCTFLEYSSYEEVFASLDNGCSDAGVVNRIFGLYNEIKYDIERTTIIFNPSYLFFAFPKNAANNELLISRIDYHLILFKEDTSSIYYQLLDKYIFSLYGYVIPEWFYPLLILVIISLAIFISLSSFLLVMAGKLRFSNKKLEKTDELKSLFVASVNHELKTPLTSILGFTSMILNGDAGPINKEQEKELSIVMRNSREMLNLIDDIMLVNQIETSNIDLDITTFNLSDLMNKLEETFSIIAREKQIDLHIKPIENIKITSDKKRTLHALSNLVSNAIKFTDRGEVLVYTEDSEMECRMMVKDTGIGIKIEDFEKLFKAFSRIQLSGQPKKGTGLGLYISQKIAYQLGGKIVVDSEFGKGSTFTLIIKKRIKKKKN